MTRIFGLNVFPEMLALWLIETGACSLMFFVLLHGTPLLPPETGLVGPAGPALDATGLLSAPLLSAPLLPAPLLPALLLALTVGLVGFATGLYRPETCLETRRLLLKTGVSAIVSLPAVWLVAGLGGIGLGGIGPGGIGPGGVGLFGLLGARASIWGGPWPLEMLLVWALLLLATRLLYTAALRMDLFVRRVAVLGAPQAAARTVGAIAGMRRFLFRVEAIQPHPAAGGAVLPAGLWGVVFAGAATETPAARRGGVVADRGVVGGGPRVRHFDGATFWEDQLGRIDLAAPGTTGAGFAAADLAAPSVAVAVVRRLLDVVLASLLLLLTAPVLLATALLIRAESRGPIIYRQERVGLGGGSFVLWKFRSMRVDAERLGPTWAALRDPRVTVVGGLIRRVRIDELPQLVNILRGEMGLVGPRPERPHFVEQLAAEIPLYRERTRVKPGLTGWAQVNYPYGASVEDARAKLSYDLYYVKHRTLLLDLLVLLATVRVILFQEGAR